MAQNLIITKNGTSEIQPTARTLRISKQLDHRGFSCSFETEDSIAEFDEITIEDGSSNVLFAGIIDEVRIISTGNLIRRRVKSSGFKRLFDRKKIAERYEDMTAGAIVSD